MTDPRVDMVIAMMNTLNETVKLLTTGAVEPLAKHAEEMERRLTALEAAGKGAA